MKTIKKTKEEKPVCQITFENFKPNVFLLQNRKKNVEQRSIDRQKTF